MLCEKCRGENSDNAKFCFHCGTALTPTEEATCAQPTDGKKKRKVLKICLIAALCVAIVVASGAAVFYVLKAQMPWWELSESGVLRFDEDSWDTYAGGIIEIPTDFDGKVERIVAEDFSTRSQFSYDGTMEELFENHEWFCELVAEKSVIQLECSDYTLFYSEYRAQTSPVWLNGRSYVSVGNYCLSESGTSDRASFMSFEDVLTWLSTDYYRFEVEDFREGNAPEYETGYMSRLGR